MVLILIFGLDKSDKFCPRNLMELVDFDSKAGVIGNPLIAVASCFFCQGLKDKQKDIYFAKMLFMESGAN